MLSIMEQHIDEVGIVIDLFRGGAGPHNGQVLLGLSHCSYPLTNRELSKKLDIEQSVTYRRLQDLKRKLCVTQVLGADRKNRYMLLQRGARVCRALTNGTKYSSKLSRTALGREWLRILTHVRGEGEW